MLKRLWFAPVWLLFSAALFCQNNNPPPPQSQTATASPSKKPVSPPAGVSQSFPWYAESEWWVVIVATLTGTVIGWQSWETRKAAEGARLSADAATAQIAMMRQKERARLIVDFKDLQLPTVAHRSTPIEINWHVTLFGQTEAFVHHSQCFAGLETEKVIDPIKRAWGEMVGLPQVISTEKRVIEGSTHVRARIGDEFNYEKICDRIVSGEDAIVCAGFIEYSDVFGERWIFTFKRKWAFFSLPKGSILPQSLLPGEWVRCGEPEDNIEQPVSPDPIYPSRASITN